MIKLRCAVERITYLNPDNGYTVLKVKVSGYKDPVTLIGYLLGYVLEFEDDEIGILFPTANGFAVSYAKGLWQFLKGIKKDSIVRILGITQTDYMRSGELLWEKPKKQTFTKAEIAERLDMNVQDFEIIDEDNEENE